ncbi:unnamed protein product, partial [Arabidopsis halleri]
NNSTASNFSLYMTIHFKCLQSPKTNYQEKKMNWKLVLLFGWILLSSIASNPTLAKVTYPPRTTREEMFTKVASENKSLEKRAKQSAFKLQEREIRESEKDGKETRSKPNSSRRLEKAGHSSGKGLGNIHINKGMKIGFTGSFSRPAPHGGGPPKIISKL